MFWKGVWGYLPANIVQGLVGFGSIVLFTRLLTPAQFGEYALAFAAATLVQEHEQDHQATGDHQDDGEEQFHGR